MRALVGLGRWEDATRSASALLALEAAPDDLRFEAHVVLAVSAFRMEQPSRAEFLEHVDHARALHPHASDVAYLELMRAAGAYLRTLDLANNPGNLEFLRIGQFWHMAEPVRELVRALALPESAHPRRGQALPADVAPARPAPEAGPTPGKQRKGASWKRPSSSVTGRR
jgi:hypothetical protein